MTFTFTFGFHGLAIQMSQLLLKTCNHIIYSLKIGTVPV